MHYIPNLQVKYSVHKEKLIIIIIIIIIIIMLSRSYSFLRSLDLMTNDAPSFADTTQVKAKRLDVTIINKTSKQARVIKKSCPWLKNRESKDFEKTT